MAGVISTHSRVNAPDCEGTGGKVVSKMADKWGKLPTAADYAKVCDECEELRVALRRIVALPIKFYERGYVSESAIEIAKEALGIDQDE